MSCTWIFKAPLFVIAKNKKYPKCPTIDEYKQTLGQLNKYYAQQKEHTTIWTNQNIEYNHAAWKTDKNTYT